MTSLLPELHEGHAPFTLHQLFREALDAYEDWDSTEPEPMVLLEGKAIPIGLVFDHMRTCSDILPANMVGAITERLTRPWTSESSLAEMPFSTAARVMCVLMRKRHLHETGAQIEAFVLRLGRQKQPRLNG